VSVADRAERSSKTSVGSVRPLTVTDPSDASANVPYTSAAVSGPMTTSPGLATSWSRAARFVVSPVAVKFRYASLPILPTRAGPVFSPMWKRGPA